MAKPLDEVVRRGGPLELELVDRCPEAMMNLQPHITVVEAEVSAA